MLIESKKPKEEFNNKYWMGLNMILALNDYCKNNDAEMLAENCPFFMSSYVYLDDISDDILLKIHNDSKNMEQNINMPVISQNLIDAGDMTFKVESELSREYDRQKVDNLFKISDWK